MKISTCKKCQYYERRVWSQTHYPTNYHAIGLSHAYGYCKKYEKRCLAAKYCRGAK